MKTSTINKKEIEKFSRIAEEWWDPTGKFKPLHKFNPIRISYIKEKIISSFKLENSDKPLQKIRLLDIGCGGGLLSEPMSRLGAEVTGIDASEKNIQLYNQLSGRAGRFSKDSIIIYQTFNPKDETLKNILKNKQDEFLEEEFLLRKKKNLPPFSRLIAFIISSKNERDGLIEAKKIKKILSSIQNIDVMGPVTSPIFKIKNNYRTRLLLRSPINLFPQKQISQALKLFKVSKKIKLTVDVDPLNFS